MSSILSGLGGAAVNAVGETVAFAGGLTGARALDPIAVAIEQEAWKLAAIRAPDALVMALGVAQGQISHDDAAAYAKATGFGPDQFAALIAVANIGPGSAYAFEMWRRGLKGEAGFRRAIKRLGWEQEWIDAAVELKEIRLSPEALAVMIQRSVVPNPGILPNQPPTANSDVPPMPVVDLDVFAEAAAHGVDADRLKAMARIIGLPASPDLAARMHFRKIINADAFNQAIKEGNTRGEWAPFLLEGFREIPTAEQFVEAHLRGWITKAEMYAGTARHGMSKPDTDLEFKIHRRPLTPHQIKQGLARGASFNPESGEITNPYSAAAHQNSLGPEWYALYEALAGSYPSLFITNRLVGQNTITPAIGRKWLEKAGNADEVVTAMHDSWTSGGTVKADPHVTKADNQLWTAQHTAYVKGRSDDAFATETLQELGASAAAIPIVLARWQRERAIHRAGLTAAQIKKGYSESAVNDATGAPWTRDEAVAALMELGSSSTEAASYLNL